MGNPCFRIIQTHFAKNNNVGDVAAKEQVRSAASRLQKPSGICLVSYDPTVVLFVWSQFYDSAKAFSELLLSLGSVTW